MAGDWRCIPIKTGIFSRKFPLSMHRLVSAKSVGIRTGLESGQLDAAMESREGDEWNSITPTVEFQVPQVWIIVFSNFFVQQMHCTVPEVDRALGFNFHTSRDQGLFPPKPVSLPPESSISLPVESLSSHFLVGKVLTQSVGTWEAESSYERSNEEFPQKILRS